MDAHYCKMHAHKVLWVLTCCEWAHTSYLCAAIHYAWSPKYVAIFTHLWATMILCVWSPMLLQWSLTIPLARPRWLVDAQQSLCMDTQEKFGASHVLLGNHELLMGTHTALCGCVCHARAHPCLYTQCGHGRVYVCARKYVGTHYARPRT